MCQMPGMRQDANNTTPMTPQMMTRVIGATMGNRPQELEGIVKDAQGGRSSRPAEERTAFRPASTVLGGGGGSSRDRAPGLGSPIERNKTLLGQ